MRILEYHLNLIFMNTITLQFFKDSDGHFHMVRDGKVLHVNVPAKIINLMRWKEFAGEKYLGSPCTEKEFMNAYNKTQNKLYDFLYTI